MATIVKTPSGTWNAMVRPQGWPTTIKAFRLEQDARNRAWETENDMAKECSAIEWRLATRYSEWMANRTCFPNWRMECCWLPEPAIF